MTASPRDRDLSELDAAVEHAICTGKPDALCVLGYGEFTLVLGWPTARPELAVKRLPLFRDQQQLECYRAVLHGTWKRSGSATCRWWPPSFACTPLRRDGVHAYLVQRLSPARMMLNFALREAEPGHGPGSWMRSPHWSSRASTSASASTPRPPTGRWTETRSRRWTSPRRSCETLRAGSARPRSLPLHLSVGGAAGAGAHRPGRDCAVSRPRTVLVDVASNLVKERPRALAARIARSRQPDASQPAITEQEVKRYFVRDRRLWLLMQWLRRADRAWQRQVRRRPYPFLLPPPYRYGPPEIPDQRSEP